MPGTEIERLRLEIHGAVQGVGFRPFVYRLAHELQVQGWVRNDPHGVFVEIEGQHDTLQRFLDRLPAERPPHAVLHTVEPTWLAAEGYEGFTIVESQGTRHPTAVVLPDLATCSDCLRDLRDPRDRRYRYPFVNCTHCGPRFTIVRELPYDRPATTMRAFRLCPDCHTEYENPLDRRFHAQPNACSRCGPRIALWSRKGESLHEGDPALQAAERAIREGRIVALKGLGGFHLVVDARNADAVAELRRRKARDEKPFAVMVPDLDAARRCCEVSREAAELLASPQAPIVLLPRLADAGTEDRSTDRSADRNADRIAGQIADQVAPGNPHLGLMLPSTPLHHLLLADLGFPVVATSGNRSDEPIAIDNLEAVERLGSIADLFLVHNRPIARHVDDSVVRIAAGAPRLLRRARGYAPLPVRLRRKVPAVLALGGQLKNTVALSVGENVFLSQHLGDMDTPQTLAACERVIHDFLELYDVEPVAVAHDLHPDYASTRLATEWAARLAGSDATEPRQDPWERLLTGDVAGVSGGNLQGFSGSDPARHDPSLPRIPVQHHHAHLAACLADCDEPGPALGVIWDGTGYGPDGTIWGGEILLGSAAGYERVAHLAPFRLPGGEAAVVEPRRVALALLWEMEGDAALDRDLPALRAFAEPERRLLGQMLDRGFHAPVTTSMGRLFDGVASLLDLHQVMAFEGQAAMAVEHAAGPWDAEGEGAGAYPLEILGGDDSGQWEAVGQDVWTTEGPWILDWRPTISALLDDLRRGVAVGTAAARFHNALLEAAMAVARRVRQRTGEDTVALSGGCFQNRWLLEGLTHRLRQDGFRPLLHERVPANDGGLSLGQVAVAAARLRYLESRLESRPKGEPTCVLEFPAS